MAVFDYLSLPAVCLSWVLYMGISSLWYSPLMFRDAFLKLAHGGKPQKFNKPGMIASALGTAFAMPFFCFMLSVAGCQSALEGALWGASFGLFFDTGLNCAHSFFEERPFGLFLLHRGCHALSLTVIASVAYITPVLFLDPMPWEITNNNPKDVRKTRRTSNSTQKRQNGGFISTREKIE